MTREIEDVRLRDPDESFDEDIDAEIRSSGSDIEIGYPTRETEEKDEDVGMMPEEIRDNPILRKMVWRRMHKKNKNWMAAICQETGGGKSYAALRIAEVLDPDFSIDQVAFSIDEFIDLVRDDSYGQGSVIVLDEAGVAAGARDWYSDSNQLLNQVLQTWRHQNRAAIFTLPALGFLDKGARTLLHAYLEPIRIDYEKNQNITKFQYLDKNPKATGSATRIYYKYPELQDPETGVRKKYKRLAINLPSEELQEAYEEKKEEFTGDLNDRVAEALEKEEEEERDPREIADEILNDPDAPDLEKFIGDNHGQKYINRTSIRLEYDISKRKTKEVKTLLLEGSENDDLV
ncbi:MAG: zonular occludens toxin (zot) [Halobacteria archaeon]|nr:zonular occludens toxin (zot) [Halobacteria archaeon]